MAILLGALLGMGTWVVGAIVFALFLGTVISIRNQKERRR